MTLNNISKFITAIKLTPNSHVLIVDANAKIIARHTKTELDNKSYNIRASDKVIFPTQYPDFKKPWLRQFFEIYKKPSRTFCLLQ